MYLMKLNIKPCDIAMVSFNMLIRKMLRLRILKRLIGL